MEAQAAESKPRTQRRQENPETLHAIKNGIVYDGLRYANMAIAQLERIQEEDPHRVTALERVRKWINSKLNS